MPIYVCKLCLKEFKQKIDYTRHIKKKNACITVDKILEIEEKKRTLDEEKKELSTLFAWCMDFLRNSESITGMNALLNVSCSLVLKLIEPMIGENKEINFENGDYGDLNEEDTEFKNKVLKYVYFSKISEFKESDLPTALEFLWEKIFSKHEKTKDIFLPKKNFTMKKQSTYKKLFDKLQEFDFRKISVDILGHAYEDLLQRTLVGRDLGQFFTPPSVKNLLVELVNPQVFEDGTCETIYDPAMGTGGFLQTSMNHIIKQAELKNIELDWDFITYNIGGREAEPDTFILTKANMLCSTGHMFNALEQGDSIREPTTKQYDIVLANPPFGIKGLEYKEIESHLRDVYMPIETKNSTNLFLQRIISLLKVGGRSCTVLPDGQELFGKNKANMALRELLVKSCDVKAIYLFPSGVFTNATIKTCAVHFYKKKEIGDVLTFSGKKTRTYKFSKTHQTKTIKFYEYNPYEKINNLLVEVDIEKLANNNYSLNYAEYLEKEEDEEEKYGDIEWKILGEVCEIKIGGTPSRKNKEYWENGTNNWVSIREMNGGYIYDTKEKITDLGVEKSSVKLYEKDTVLFSFKLSIGKTAIVGTPMYSNEAIAGLTPKDKEYLLYKYLYHYLTITDFSNMGAGTFSKGSLNKESLSNLKIPVPPLPIQERIVKDLDFLYETDIKTTQEKIEVLKKKRELVINLGINGYNTENLEKVCTMKKKGTVNSKSASNTGEYPFYKASVSNPCGTHSEYCFDGDKYILFVKSGGNAKNPLSLSHGIGKSYLVSGKTCGNSEVACIIPDTNIINSIFLYYILQLNQLSIQKLAKYSTNLGHIDMEKFKSLQIPLPPLPVQKSLVEKCEKLDKLISDLECTIEETKELAKQVLNKSLQLSDEPVEVLDPSYDPISRTTISQEPIGSSDEEIIEDD